ncbi:MAG: dihydrodipicolinate reductase [Armatimonadota bacterium]|nr:MAG: dihydrodipicolinate reductase [Armatimonadota bacterium]
MPDKMRVVQIGLGALGRMLTSYLLDRPQIEIVGAADLDPSLAGRDLGEVSGLGRKLGLAVCDDLRKPFADGPVDVAVLTTVSHLPAANPQIEALIACSTNVISSCEELSYPRLTAPETSAEIDRLARDAGVSVLGTGVNPGFLMDILPTALTAVCREVRKITVLRCQDARPRRLPFQQKIGAGLNLQQFEKKKADGSLRHVGLTESMHLIGSRLGWKLDHTEDIIEPVIAEREVSSDYITVKPGQAAGVYQLGLGYAGDEEKIRLEFRASLGEPDRQDTVIVEGVPDLKFTVPGGINGDVATCSILTNAVPTVIAAPPGLRTMADIPPLSWFSARPLPTGAPC